MLPRSLPPGTFDYDDFRDPRSRPSSPQSTIRIVQWNIERGYQLPRIIQTLQSLDADIIALQEVDVHCHRSHCHDTGRTIAHALSLNYVYLCEFIELYSEKRSAALQGGGHHGHALLTKYDVRECAAVRHSHQPVDWTNDGLRLNEPRIGERISMRVTVDVPSLGPMIVYNAHFEVFCGLQSRVEILADIFNDSRSLLAQYPNQIIAMDANTMAHSIARLSPNYCRDSHRWRSIGWTESEIWAAKILSFYDWHGSENSSLRTLFPLPSLVPVHCRNPGFIEPFDCYDDVTLINWYGIYQAKLDWLLLTKNFHLVSQSMGNDDYRASDHKYLLVECAVHERSEESEQWVARYHRLTRHSPGALTCRMGASAAMVSVLALASLVTVIVALFVPSTS